MYENADGVLGKKVSTAARNISEKALCLIESRRGLCKNYLSDRLYENKRNVNKVEKALKYELRRCEVKAMDKIVRMWKMQLDGIIVKNLTDMLIN